MNKIRKWYIFLPALLLMASGVFNIALADHDDHNKRRHQKKERRHSEHNRKHNLTIVNNATYTENCGACHFAYQPELLPSGSWDKILNSFPGHFGETIEIDADSKKAISEYLRLNAADNSSAKLSARIMKSIGNQTPSRITEIPYIKKNHHEISQNVVKRESVGSLSNCSACHTAAESGIYNDDNVKVPK